MQKLVVDDAFLPVNTEEGLQRLLIQEVRNIRSADIRAFSQINIFFGPNGSGKTSVLEAIAFLATAKSFRNAQIQRFIHFDARSCAVYGEWRQKEHILSLGVNRDKDGVRKIKVQGVPVLKLIDLAQHLPFQLINHKTFHIFHEGPNARRQLLDWGVFHVEQDFRVLWLRLQRGLKQRNALLRLNTTTDEELEPWNKEMIILAESLDKKRQQHIKALQPLFLYYLHKLLPIASKARFELRYAAGWPKQQDSYAQVLNMAQPKDRQRGFTQFGPHKAHLNIYWDGVPIADCMSRGQLKMLIIAFKLAQGHLLHQSQGTRCLYLIDDLPSELDAEHLALVCAELVQSKAQIFVSCIEETVLKEAFSAADYRLFHVEHGKITTLKKPV